MECAKTRNGGLSSMMIYGNIIYAWCIQSFRKHSSLASHDDIMKNLEVCCNPVLHGRRIIPSKSPTEAGVLGAVLFIG
jgi:hypothetical protein